MPRRRQKCNSKRSRTNNRQAPRVAVIPVNLGRIELPENLVVVDVKALIEQIHVSEHKGHKIALAGHVVGLAGHLVMLVAYLVMIGHYSSLDHPTKKTDAHTPPSVGALHSPRDGRANIGKPLPRPGKQLQSPQPARTRESIRKTGTVRTRR